jgi:hypothetical protein
MSDETRPALILSIDVDAGCAASDLAGLRTVERAACRLLDALRRQRMRATWGLAQLGASSFARRLVDAGHEPAVLAEAHWTGAEVDRNRFASELAERCDAIVGSGARTTTVLQHDGSMAGPLDVLVRRGIRAVRPALATTRSGGWLGRAVAAIRPSRRGTHVPSPRTLRWGIWELAAHCRMTGIASRKIVRTISHPPAGGPVHLAVDLPYVAFGGERAAVALERLVGHIAGRRDAGHLSVLTASDLVARLDQGNLGRPARSILEAA